VGCGSGAHSCGLPRRYRAVTGKHCFQPNAPGNALYPYYSTTLAPYDLTRGGVSYVFSGHTDIKELALYVRDNITVGNCP